MSARNARGLLCAFVAAYTIFLVYPGILPFNRIRPLILGLPFLVFWVAAWIATSGVVLWAVHRVDRRPRGED